MSRYVCRTLLKHLRKDSFRLSRVLSEHKFLKYNAQFGANSFSTQVYNERETYRKKFRRNIDKDIEAKGNPDVFGNLTEALAKEIEFNNMPEEEGDVVTSTFYDGKVGKTKLRTKEYADLIKNYLKQNKVYDAIRILEEKMIKEDKVRPENYIYNLLIDGCAKVGFTEKAFKLYNDMKKRDLKVTGATYTSLFNACALSPIPGDGLKRATRLVEIIQEKQYEPNRSNYHAMMKAFGRCGDLVTAFSIVDHMISKNIPVRADTFSFLLQACLSDKNNGFRHALLVWRKLRERRVKPTIFCYNLMVRCARDCHLGSATDVVKDLNLPLDKQEEVKLLEGETEISEENDNLVAPSTSEPASPPQLPNLLANNPQMGSVISINNLFKPKHRLMLLGGTLGFLEQMKADEVKPDIKTATILLQMTSGTSEEMEFIESLRKSGIVLDIDFCNMLIKKRCYRRDFIAAHQVLNLISELKLVPNLMTFGVLALSCRNMTHVRQFLQDLELSGFRLNMEIIGGLMYAARHTWNVVLVMLLMDKVVEEEIKVSRAFMTHIEKFRDLTLNQVELKKEGKPYHEKVDNEMYMKLFDQFLDKFKLWSKTVDLDDRELLHPWTQYKKPTALTSEQITN